MSRDNQEAASGLATSREQNQEAARQELHAALAAVLNSDDGRRVMFWLLEMCQIYGEAFSTDAAMTGYRLGRAAIGRQIIAMMNEIDEGFYPRFLLAAAAGRQVLNREQETGKGNEK